MLNKYDVLEKLVIASGYTGKILVWMGLFAGCILIWYFVFVLIFNN